MTSTPESGSHDHWVFMYGTLKTGQPNHDRLYDVGRDGVRFVGPAVTDGRFPLVITTPSNIPFLLFHDGSSGNKILGEVYRVNNTTMDHLDEFEHYPKVYDRKLIDVTLTTANADPDSKQNRHQCWVYCLSRFKASLLELPQYNEYRSAGDHNKPYESIAKDSNLDDYNKYIFEDES